MMPSKKNKLLRCWSSQKGLSLLETMLVTSLILFGILIGLQQYKKTVLNRKVAQIQNSVKLLTTALEQYYLVNCIPFLGSGYAAYTINLSSNLSFLLAPSNPVNPTLNSYITQPNLIDNLYNASQHGLNAYTYTIDVSGDFPIIRINTTFNVPSAMQNILAGLLKPTSRSGNQFTWSSSPGNTYLTVPNLNANLSYMKWLSMNFTNPSTTQISTQYTYNGQVEANICIYWQQPKNRCVLTKDNTHCDYKNKPS